MFALMQFHTRPSTWILISNCHQRLSCHTGLRTFAFRFAIRFSPFPTFFIAYSTTWRLLCFWLLFFFFRFAVVKLLEHRLPSVHPLIGYMVGFFFVLIPPWIHGQFRF